MNKFIILSTLVLAVFAAGQWTEKNLNELQNDSSFAAIEKIARGSILNVRNDVEPKLVKVDTQVVQGMNYKFTYENFDRLCYVTVWSQSWNNLNEVTKSECDAPKHQKGFDAEAWEKKNQGKPEEHQKGFDAEAWKQNQEKKNLGGWRNIDSKGLIGTDELKSDLYSKAQEHVFATYGINENLNKKSVETKIVAGAMYRVTMESEDNTVYQVYFLSQPWVQNGTYQIVDTQVLRKEENNTNEPMVGGWSAVNGDLTDEFTGEVIAEAKNYIYGVTGYNGILVYQSMQQKVINGVAYKVDFGSMDGTTYSVEILFQPWNAEKKFEVLYFNVVKTQN